MGEVFFRTGSPIGWDNPLDTPSGTWNGLAKEDGLLYNNVEESNSATMERQ
jgi:hypothetical protein